LRVAGRAIPFRLTDSSPAPISIVAQPYRTIETGYPGQSNGNWKNVGGEYGLVLTRVTPGGFDEHFIEIAQLDEVTDQAMAKIDKKYGVRDGFLPARRSIAAGQLCARGRVRTRGSVLPERMRWHPRFGFIPRSP